MPCRFCSDEYPCARECSMIARTYERVIRTVAGMLVALFLVLQAVGPKSAVAENTPDDPSQAQLTCGYGPTHPISQVSQPEIREASALVASQQWPGIYWTFNDSKNPPTLFALDAN